MNMKINNDINIPEISKSEAERNGVDLTMVKLCEKLRRLAKIDHLHIDDSIHASGINKHLFSYIEYCGYTIESYIKEYLCNLQPYMLKRQPDQQFADTILCVLDTGYQISLYIKADIKQHSEVVISFHEDYLKNGLARPNKAQIGQNDKLIPVFAEDITYISPNTNSVGIRVMLQRGMLSLPIDVAAIKCENVFLVNKGNLERAVLEKCNDYIRQICMELEDIDINILNHLTQLEQLSFTAYGRDVFSTISLLIDTSLAQNNSLSKRAADFALSSYIQSLRLTQDQKEELSELLEERYQVTASIKTPEIVTHVRSQILKTTEIPLTDKTDIDDRYNYIRNDHSDIIKISQCTGYTQNQIFLVKNYLFLETHQFSCGISRFIPCTEIADSWERLQDAKTVTEHDIILIKHELEELNAVLQGKSIKEAHAIANTKYNYEKSCQEFYQDYSHKLNEENGGIYLQETGEDLENALAEEYPS